MLFPYARARVHDYLEHHADDPGVRADVALLRAEHAAESSRSPDLPPWNPEAYVYWLMDRDRKSTGLKALQGRIWEAGYRAGALKGKGEVYPDVRPALVRWRDAGKKIAIFSSGSVQAQRNLFENTIAGDLSQFLSGYFDTTTGPKGKQRVTGTSPRRSIRRRTKCCSCPTCRRSSTQRAWRACGPRSAFAGLLGPTIPPRTILAFTPLPS